MTARRVLILGGTLEAAELAARLDAADGFHPISSLAGRTGAPRPLPGEVRIGGFGGANGLARYLSAHRIDMLVDATHPFAAAISRNAAEACRQVGLPWLRLERPPWAREVGDQWIEVEDAGHATRSLPESARQVFLSIGRQDLAPFAARTDVGYLVRMIEPPAEPLPLARYTLVLGRGPFDAEAEAALLGQHGIDAVVSKNSGGDATYGKIVAARRLGLSVVMIRRPPEPEADRVATVAAALDWIAARAGRRRRGPVG